MNAPKRYNSRGNWWYADDVCIEEGCDTLIDSCDNEYAYYAKGQRIIRCREHYGKLHRERQAEKYALGNAVAVRAIKKAGGQAAYDALPKQGKERKALRAEARAEILSESAITISITEHSNVVPFPPVFENSREQVETVTKGRKRDQKVVTHVRKMYDSCSVEGCDYSDFDVAHIHALKHGSDDLPSNCLALCPNHHRDLDRGRLQLADPSDRSATDPIMFSMYGDEGRIILSEHHEVHNDPIRSCISEIDRFLSNREEQR